MRALLFQKKISLLTLCKRLLSALEGGLSLQHGLEILKKDPQFSFLFSKTPQATLQALELGIHHLAPPNSPFKTLKIQTIVNFKSFLTQSIAYLETRQVLRKTLIKKITYPAILFGILCLLLLSFIYVLIPHYYTLFEQLSTPIPPYFLKIQTLATYLRTYGHYCFATFGMCIALVYMYLRSTDAAILYRISNPFYRSQFLWSLGLGLSNGFSLKSLLHHTHVPKHHPFHTLLSKFKEKIHKTGYFLPAFQEHFKPDTLLHEMLHQALTSGHFNTQLLYIAHAQFEREKTRLEAALFWVQPLLLCAISIAIICATLLVLLPLQSSFQSLL